MFVTKMALDRRMFLRGVGATLALPLLDAMTPAFAAPSKAIPRLAFMYVPNGINIAQWTPSGSGKDFAFSPTLKSLEPFRERVNVLSGLALHSADRMGDGAGDHSRATGAFLSGCHAKRTQGADLLLGITADQIAAKSLGKDNLLPSLELGIADQKNLPALRRRLYLHLQQHALLELRRPRRCRWRTIPGWCLSASLAKAATPNSEASGCTKIEAFWTPLPAR